ncbi:MAG TPA: hypothetical protein VFL16_14070 [Steroidobacteraceae bacterium]|nr:hypothetical protein [Steroidobacteraceae bacterium]
MKTTTLVLGVIAAGTAAASIYLGAQLTAANDQLVAEQSARARAEALNRTLEADRDALLAELESAGVSTPAATPAGPPAVAANGQKSAAASMPGVDVPTPGAERRDKGASTPAEQNVRRINQEVRLRRRYAGMPEELGLDAAQADKLYNLLADYQAKAGEDSRAYQYDSFGRQAVNDANKAQRDADIEALLGPDKAAQFQDFEKSIPARMQVNRIGEGMAAANVPLSEAQRKSLIAAVASEQESGPPPQHPAGSGYDPGYEMKFLDWQADYSKRVQARIEPLLSSEQLARYRDAVEVQNTRRADARARAERRRSQGGS